MCIEPAARRPGVATSRPRLSAAVNPQTAAKSFAIAARDGSWMLTSPGFVIAHGHVLHARGVHVQVVEV